MAFTEASLESQFAGAISGHSAKKVIHITAFIVSASNVDVYAIGVADIYHGRSRWVQIPSSNTAAQAAALIQSALTA